MTRYRQNPRVAFQILDGSAFLVQPKDHTMHRLDEVGTVIWEALEGARTAAEVAAAVEEAFEVEPATAEADAREFLDELARRGLVIID